MIISIIVAMDEQRGIGWSNSIPWHLPLDLRRFKRLTMGHFLIMGRKTWESIGKPLPGRKMIILTHQNKYLAEGYIIANSLSEALDLVKRDGDTEVFVIGGGELFSQTIALADRLYISYIHTVVPSDVLFPEINLKEWIEKEREYHPADKNNEYAHTFVVYDKVK